MTIEPHPEIRPWLQTLTLLFNHEKDEEMFSFLANNRENIMHDINILCGFKTKRARKNRWTWIAKKRICRERGNRRIHLTSLYFMWMSIDNAFCILLHRLVLKSFASFFFLFYCFIFYFTTVLFLLSWQMSHGNYNCNEQ